MNPPPKSERFEMRIDSELLARIDEVRRMQSDLPSRAEALRRLSELAMLPLHAYRARIVGIARGRGSAAKKLEDAKAVNEEYVVLARETFGADAERVQSAIQQLGDANRPSNEPESNKLFFDAVREHIRRLVGL
jgi:hypothetical protein